MICCAHCDYKTNRPYNLKRHEISKHFDTIYNESEENGLITDSTNIDTQSSDIDTYFTNIDISSTNMKDDYSCKDCYKIFKSIYNLKKHKSVCKKIKNPLECNFCHVVYASPETLCRHKKSCKGKLLIIPDKQEDIINTYNCKVNIFPSDIESSFTLYTDHIDPVKLKKDIEGKNLLDAAALSLRLLMQNKDNLPVRKSNMQSKYSYVHLGDNKWTLYTDAEIYSLLSYHISNCFKIYLKNNNITKLERYYSYLKHILEHIIYESTNKDEKDMVQKAKHFMNILILEAYKNNSKKEN